MTGGDPEQDNERADRWEMLDHAERWLGDGCRVIDPPGAFAAVDVDMSRSRDLIERLRQSGTRITYTHLFARAAALALARRPEIHFLVVGNHRLRPGSVDIGLSVAGDTFIAPVIILEGAEKKRLPDLAREIEQGVPEARARDRAQMESLRRWGRLLPVPLLRRAVLRFLRSRAAFRRRASGTFQVSCLSTVDVLVPFLFNTAGILGAGRVRDRVVPVEGRPAVRPTVTLTCCIDHKAWDGVRAATFLTEVKKILEEGDMEGEACP